MHPKVREQRRMARQQWRARKREREAQLAAARCRADNVDAANSAETGTQVHPACSMPTSGIIAFPEGKHL
jgi:hypothetical protein